MSAQASNDGVLWSIRVSKEADQSVRGFLAGAGLPAEDLGRFVEESVRWRLLRMTVDRVRAGVTGIDGPALDELIDEATEAARAEHRKRTG